MQQDPVETLRLLLACDRQFNYKTISRDSLSLLVKEINRSQVKGIITIGGFIDNQFDPVPIFEYTASHDRWTQSRIRLPVKYALKPWIGASSATLKDGSTLVCNATDTLNDAMGFIFNRELYQPGGPAKWVTFDSIPYEDAVKYACRSNACLVTLHDGKVLRLGGRVKPEIAYSVDVIPNAVYDPKKKKELVGPVNITSRSMDLHTKGVWSALDVHAAMPWGAFSVVLGDGNVLVTGGFYPPERTRPTCYLLNTATGKLVLTGSMMQARSHHAGCLLPNGRVFICGGTHQDGRGYGPVLTCEEYDPFEGSWSKVDVTTRKRMGHSCTLLHTGKVLIVGGWDVEMECELYDPESRVVTLGARLPARLSGFVTIPVYD